MNYNKWLFLEATKFKEVTYTSLGDRNIPQISKLMPFQLPGMCPTLDGECISIVSYNGPGHTTKKEKVCFQIRKGLE